MPVQATSGAASYDAFGSAAIAAPVYVEDVFSTYLYTGTSANQTITNNIDLSGKGGMVWTKSRNGANGHIVVDSLTGPTSYLSTNTTGALSAGSTTVTAFTSTGFTLGNSANANFSGDIYASWTFAQQAKFFDVLAYTGDGNSSNALSHTLNGTIGCAIIKRTSGTSDWSVWVRNSSGNYANWNGNSSGTGVGLNSNLGASNPDNIGYNSAFTTTTLNVGTGGNVGIGALCDANVNGATYVAYLFAHDTTTTGLIQCSSYTGTSGSNTISLGWEPQWLMIKRADSTSDWWIVDTMRGLRAPAEHANVLLANSSAAESTAATWYPYVTATGFSFDSASNGMNSTGGTYIYIAIRRGPMKTPTSGTSVFQPTVYTGTNVDNRLVNTTIAPDMVWVRQRDSTTVEGMVVGDRLRGQPYLLTDSTAGEVNDADAFDQQIVSATKYGTAFSAMDGFWCGNDATASLNANTTSNNQIAEAFKRAPGVFDIVCYTGNASAQTLSHNLGKAPELIITKNRAGSPTVTNFMVGASALDSSLNQVGILNTNAAFFNNNAYYNGVPTTTTYRVDVLLSDSTVTYVSYLFATVAGVSKVGSYTGNGGTAGTNGTSQTINCGFTAGSRFVLIKRTDSTGDWYVFDSARGIVAGNDPYVLTNSTAAEVTTVDAVDTDNSGFIVNQTSGTDLNVTSATYLFLAIA